MNIITIADIEKFLLLAKAGVKHGQKREMRIYDSVSKHACEGVHSPQEHYINLEFRFHIKSDIIDQLFVTEDLDTNNKIQDLLKGLQQP
jgi:hypothetical protein